MMRLMMEAFMILAIVGGMVFMSKMSASENNSSRLVEDEIGKDSDTKDADSA